MISGISMGHETCRILGQVSLCSLYWKRTSRRKNVVRGEINEKTAHIQARSFMARNLENNGKKRQAENTHENCEGSISLTRRIKNSKEPSRMPVRNWKHQLRIVGVVHPIKLEKNKTCVYSGS